MQVAAATLANLPGMTAARLRDLVAHAGGPAAALVRVLRGAHGETWARAAAGDRIAGLLAARRPTVFVRGRPGYPVVDELPGMPEVLLAEGAAVDAFSRGRVAVVGTRAATPHGLADAREVGAVLGTAGITVVSGLAIGIDAAAHEGALEAGGVAVGVLGTGLDVVYPRRHQNLFARVRAQGLLVSELAYGAPPRRETFPVRNRIIAALADVVVVIEATARGGARITAERAVEYGRPVLAMPGSRRNPAAEGTNALIADGAEPLLEPSDVLLALGLTPGARGHDTREQPEGDAAAVLQACGGEPASLDQLASRTELAVERVVSAVRALERAGWLERAQGMCWPR